MHTPKGKQKRRCNGGKVHPGYLSCSPWKRRPQSKFHDHKRAFTIHPFVQQPNDPGEVEPPHQRNFPPKPRRFDERPAEQLDRHQSTCHPILSGDHFAVRALAQSIAKLVAARKNVCLYRRFMFWHHESQNTPSHPDHAKKTASRMRCGSVI